MFAKCDGIGRAALLTSGLQLAIFNQAAQVFGFIFRISDSLNAERAFFHDPTASDRDFRILRSESGGNEFDRHNYNQTS